MGVVCFVQLLGVVIIDVDDAASYADADTLWHGVRADNMSWPLSL